MYMQERFFLVLHWGRDARGSVTIYFHNDELGSIFNGVTFRPYYVAETTRRSMTKTTNMVYKLKFVLLYLSAAITVIHHPL